MPEHAPADSSTDALGAALSRALRAACRASGPDTPPTLMLTPGRSSRVLLALAARECIAVDARTVVGARSPVAMRRVPPALAAHVGLPWRAVTNACADGTTGAAVVVGRSSDDLAAALRPGSATRRTGPVSPYDDPSVLAALAVGDASAGGIAARLGELLESLWPALATVPVDPPDSSFGWWDGAVGNRRAWPGLLARVVGATRAPAADGNETRPEARPETRPETRPEALPTA